MAEVVCDTKTFTIAVAALVKPFLHIWRTPPPIRPGEGDWIGVDIKNMNNFKVELKLRLLSASGVEIDDWPEVGWRKMDPNEGFRVGSDTLHAALECLHMKNMPPEEATLTVEACVQYI